MNYPVHCRVRTNIFLCADEMFMFMYWNTDRPLRLKVVFFFAVVTDGVPSLIRIWGMIEKFEASSVED